jgi:hypothetical protein
LPIVEPAPWRSQYFAHVACPDDVWIPTDDPESWLWYPEHRWVYDKLRVALSQDLVAGPHGVPPPHYPVFSKPIMNLRGMGEGSRVLASREEYERHYAPGHMWMPLLEGPHVSTDMAVVSGEARWVRHATGKPTTGGMFDYWTVHSRSDPQLADGLAAWVARHFAGYTGLCNFETIGGTIIEAHLRFADQWPDLYGAGWVEAIVRLYRDRQWRFDDADRRDGFSLALFVPHGDCYRHPPRAMVDAILARPGISSVQITFHEDRAPELHAMPPGGFRLALVNCWELEAGFAARAELKAWFLEKGRVRARQADQLRR